MHCIQTDGYEIWEHIQLRWIDVLGNGASKCLFSMLIPESFFEKEKDHIEGFTRTPLVTEAAGEKLEERLALDQRLKRWLGIFIRIGLKLSRSSCVN